MRIYYDTDGRILFTFSGADSIAPAGNFIEVDNEINITEWRVEDGELVQIPGAALHSERESASLSKPEFIIACMSVGLLNPSEAAEAAKGEIPAAFQSAVDQMSPFDRDMLNVIWPTATKIERLDPLIIALASESGISEETLDALFGIVEYEP